MNDELTNKPIDAHTHVFPDDLAKRAMASLSGDSPEFSPASDGTRAGLLAQMDEAGVGRAVAAMIATKPSQTPSIFRFCESLRGPRLIPFPSIHPADPDAAAWIEKASHGFAGVKVHPQYQGIPLDDPGLIGLLRMARDTGLIVLMHAGQDPAFPGDMRARPVNMARLLDAAEGVRMIVAHFGGWKDWNESFDCLAGREGLTMDTSCSLAWLPADLARAIIEKHGADHFVFGSDSPWTDIAEERARVESLGLPEETTRKILWKNAERLLACDA